MAEGSAVEMRQLARHPVEPEPLPQVLAAIDELVACVRANEPGTLVKFTDYGEIAPR